MSKADEIKNKMKKSQPTRELLNAYENLSDDNKATSYENVKQNSNLKQLKSMKEKPKMEETHVRHTFLIKRELSEELNELTEKMSKGFKTEFINYAIEQALKQLDE